METNIRLSFLISARPLFISWMDAFIEWPLLSIGPQTPRLRLSPAAVRSICRLGMYSPMYPFTRMALVSVPSSRKAVAQRKKHSTVCVNQVFRQQI
ncbi:hypothetical protein JWG42_07870 [Desulfoprunum benzoelyticum]|uniref:Uncharacterized protein n=1 Tax=Desulfoprunum benzoelyticum TaxID=1506996 RepID=A0A840UR08_9BACT|nr:hypothetical protein [Desulfoprunum benzoelyticum]MBB5348657.1 hypothetical protein [Desulfoprunum benzoelyticum]MBM9530063.1 hypothetical protein [Desulfoprunum benzoelyticum]